MFLFQESYLSTMSRKRGAVLTAEVNPTERPMAQMLRREDRGEVLHRDAYFEMTTTDRRASYRRLLAQKPALLAVTHPRRATVRLFTSRESLVGGQGLLALATTAHGIGAQTCRITRLGRSHGGRRTRCTVTAIVLPGKGMNDVQVEFATVEGRTARTNDTWTCDRNLSLTDG